MGSIPLTRTLRGIPPLDSFTAVTDPVDRAVQLTGLARAVGTLPSPYARLRASSLLEALPGRLVHELAAEVGVHPSQVSRLVGRARLAGVTT